MRILPAWLREFVNIPADNRQLAEDLTSAGIAVESVEEELGATFYEMDLTTNRVDAMNHYGVAREASAIYDVALKPLEPKLPATKAEAQFPVVIEDAQGCARYTARVVRNVKIGASPENVAKRLELLGSRSINNAADATNYALNELGHPTHAFDLDLLEGSTIIVRRARAGEALKTLDGVDRKLTTEDLVIADARKPVALAGVMGGFGTMITENTRNVLIESAWFDPATVRAMAKRHGMHTDASHRFERGADWGITPLACDRVAELILESAGGALHGDRIDTIARTPARQPVTLRSSEVRRNLGIDIAGDQIKSILSRLGFEVTASPSGGEFSVLIPTWRLDVEREIDLLEELARIYGFNKFPNRLPAFVGAVIELPNEPKNAKVRETMLALGYDETISITFISRPDASFFGSQLRRGKEVPKEVNDSGPDVTSSRIQEQVEFACWLAGCPELVELANPLSEEAGYMRTSLLPGLLNQVSHNLNRGTADVRLFETGEVFHWQTSAELQLGDRLHERRHLGFIASGNAVRASVHSPAEPFTFFHMKGDIEELLPAFQYSSLHFDTLVPGYFHPGRAARAVMDGETVAVFGQLHPDQASARKLRQEVFLAEVMLDRLYRNALREPRYQRISKFPAVGRDFSFVFRDAVTFDKIRSAAEGLRIAELTAFAPGEIYRGEKVGAGKYSVLLHAEFQSKERTLRDDEVAQWSAQIISKLEALGGALRAQ